MIVLHDLSGLLAPENRGHVARAESLFGARNRGEDLPGDRDGILDQFGLPQTEITRTAMLLLVFLVEVLHQHPMPANPSSRKAVHLANLSEGVCPDGIVDLLFFPRFLQDPLPGSRVFIRVQQDAFGLETVPPRPAGLLLIGLDRLGHAGMHDVADVRSVDSHPECHGRDHHVTLLAAERVLCRLALLRRHPRVVADRLDSATPEPVGDRIDVLAADAVDDAPFTRMPFDDVDDLEQAAGSGHDAVDEVRSIEVPDQRLGVTQSELFDDVFPDPARRGRGERVNDRVGKPVAKLRQQAVVRTEVMPPVTDAMRFVDGEAGHACPA